MSVKKIWLNYFLSASSKYIKKPQLRSSHSHTNPSGHHWTIGYTVNNQLCSQQMQVSFRTVTSWWLELQSKIFLDPPLDENHGITLNHSMTDRSFVTSLLAVLTLVAKAISTLQADLHHSSVNSQWGRRQVSPWVSSGCELYLYFIITYATSVIHDKSFVFTRESSMFLQSDFRAKIHLVSFLMLYCD